MTYRPDESEHRHNRRVRCVGQRRAEAALSDFDEDIERVSDVNKRHQRDVSRQCQPCKPTSPTSIPNSASPPACNSVKKQLATCDQYFYGSANYIETHCSVFFSNYLAETRNYPPTRLRPDSCLHPINDASDKSPGCLESPGYYRWPAACSVSLRRWAVHDGCYGVDPRGSVVVGGPADENPAGRRRGVPRWACAGQRSAGQAVDHGVSR